MKQPTEMDKLAGYTKCLVEQSMRLLTIISTLKPLAKNNPHLGKHGYTNRSTLDLIRYSLFQQAVIQVYNICRASDPKAASIKTIMGKLEQDGVSAKLSKGQNAMKARQLAELKHSWERLQKNTHFEKIKNIRDKVAAHAQIEYKNGTYSSHSLVGYDIKHSQFIKFVDELFEVVRQIDLVVLNSEIDWSSRIAREDKKCEVFWEPVCQPPLNFPNAP